MFEEKLDWAMHSRGLTLEAFDSLLRDEPYLSDNKFFAISRFISETNAPIFYNKKLGDKEASMDIICRRFDIAVTYTVMVSNPCRISIDFNTLEFTVEYTDSKLIIDRNLSDYRGEHTKLLDLRQMVLNEIMIRYFSKILYAMYNELRWFK